MGNAERTFISRGNDYVDFLNSQLRGLSGWRTLAYELIQNADDAGKEGTKAAEYCFDELWRDAAVKEPTVRRRLPLNAKVH